ncbi:hypothetical protein [Hyphococcus luteus]|uniref:Uncharacterized protein n=1 Tax=Hyphococcus luteus TaxID=2058213 RepID=A0A2S7K6B9_9PROT|nr:hypothetical protein [Marinicaulis flavus]PQA88064.1 hypothetical protein CW354_06975 [Marinicaulis flavus]
MSMTMNRRRLIAAASAMGLAMIAGGQAGAQNLPGLKPPCESNRDVAGWTVTAGLAPDSSGELLISKWETSRDFSAYFGLSVSLDTSDSPVPSLLIRHHNRGGKFVMRLPNRTTFTVPVNASYSVTQANVPPEVIDYLRATPLLMEFSVPGRKWDRYETEGLPEAIKAAEADLAALKARQADKECSAHKNWWRRF